MKQRFFSQSLKPEDAPQIIEEFRTLYNWVGSNPDILLRTLTTTAVTTTDIASVYLNEGDVVLVEAQVVAKETDETNRALYWVAGLFYRNTGGNVTQQGSTAAVITAIESDADWNVTLNADTTAQAADIRVIGKASTNINWRCIVKSIKVT